MSHRSAYVLFSLGALLWAGNFPASKLGLTELGPLLTLGRHDYTTTVGLGGVVLTTLRERRG